MQANRVLQWEGRSIAWGRAGDGPPVVFCHGTPFSSVVWEPFARELSRDYTVYLWDMPGYGASSKDPAHPVDFGVQARAFGALLEHWNVESPHVIAHDFGGAVALRAHLGGGIPYSSLLLLDAVAIPPVGSPFFTFVQEHPGLLDQLPPYIHAAIVTAYIRAASHQGLGHADLEVLVKPWTSDEGQAAFYRQIADFDSGYLDEIQAHLGQMDIPVAILWGADDVWIPARVGEVLRDSIPGATLTQVPGAGHLIQYDAPVALADSLRAWLTRQASG